jgi:hypothetical protein
MANTYGNTGNRWWDGLNVGESGSQSTIFGTPSIAALNPSTPSGYESLPSGNAADDALFAAAAARNKGSTNPETISVENIEWFNIQGPYASQAIANAAIPAIEAANPASGTLAQIAKDNAGNPLGAAANVLGDISQGFKASISGISGTNLVIRGAKIIIGALILLVGLAKVSGLDSKSGSLAAKAVKAAPFLV